jgi:hypothetical protein
LLLFAGTLVSLGVVITGLIISDPNLYRLVPAIGLAIMIVILVKYVRITEGQLQNVN